MELMLAKSQDALVLTSISKRAFDSDIEVGGTQACVAMLVGATVEEVVAVMKNDKGKLYHKAKIQSYLVS